MHNTQIFNLLILIQIIFETNKIMSLLKEIKKQRLDRSVRPFWTFFCSVLLPDFTV